MPEEHAVVELTEGLVPGLLAFAIQKVHLLAWNHKKYYWSFAWEEMLMEDSEG